MVKLGVNIDHIATLRQQRKIGIPDISESAKICEQAGADGITVHLREDRRHIQDSDVYMLRKIIKIKLNLEMSISSEIIKIALDVKPNEVCIVPEKRQELTTEGGLDVLSQKQKIKNVVNKLKSNGIIVSLFIDPDIKQVQASKEVSADCIELHTGRYAEDCSTDGTKRRELEKLKNAGKLAVELGLILNAGHGLDYKNVTSIAKIPNINTLNIGFSIIARAIFVGFYNAVREMKLLIEGAIDVRNCRIHR